MLASRLGYLSKFSRIYEEIEFNDAKLEEWLYFYLLFLLNKLSILFISLEKLKILINTYFKSQYKIS